MTQNIKLYGAIISKSMRQFATYRTNIFAGIVSALFMLGARWALWVALFATGNAGDITLAETMTFFVVGDFVMVWMGTSFGDVIGEDNRSGDIALKITRPCSYHFQLLAERHSVAVIETLTKSVPIFIAAAVLIGILPPIGAGAFGLFVLAVLLGGAVYFLVDLIISYSVFWLTDYWYVRWYQRAILQLFGGTVLPLWFYPDWLRAIADVLPFRFVMFAPMEIYLGRLSGADVYATFVAALFWIFVLFCAERLIWRRVQYKLVVQGG
ncbi:MAG: ABC-2 family transporter protein [Defluviitaleaceae bacterium]|nr:ABC-2 family transporter protein [Defluviitaleaceae bacterium]MCL2264291.1 ABC-2 family transporter protein [Defluviitaleaceae bacterium]